MLKEKWSLKQLSNRETVTNWVSGILLVMYIFTFLMSLIASWSSPHNTTLTITLERWLVALTPLIVAILHRYLRQSDENNETDQVD